MPPPGDWKTYLEVIDKLMRDVSWEHDPQKLVLMYGEAVDQFFPVDHWLSVSRRGLEPPYYRITRNSNWSEEINPWTERDRLPVLSGGTVGEWAYADKPIILPDFTADDVDPHYELLRKIRSVLVLPLYDNGRGINASIMMWERPNAFDPSAVPFLHWQANLFGRTTHNLVLRRELAEAYASLDRELLVVGDIQRSLLPRALPRLRSLELAAEYRTSQRAGGDYYDLFPLPEDRVGLFIADVSGHGTPAAVMMAVTHAIAHSHPGDPEPPERVLSRLNKTLHERYTGTSGHFVTAFYGVFDGRRRTLTYSSAGHNPPRVRSGSSIIGLEGASSIPLGLDPGTEYTAERARLHEGDLLVLYTDGIVEAMDAGSQHFGVERLDKAIAGATSAPDAVAKVLEAIDAFAGPPPPRDDQTVLAGTVQ